MRRLGDTIANTHDFWLFWVMCREKTKSRQLLAIKDLAQFVVWYMLRILLVPLFQLSLNDASFIWVEVQLTFRGLKRVIRGDFSFFFLRRIEDINVERYVKEGWIGLVYGLGWEPFGYSYFIRAWGFEHDPNTWWKFPKFFRGLIHVLFRIFFYSVSGVMAEWLRTQVHSLEVGLWRNGLGYKPSGLGWHAD